MDNDVVTIASLSDSKEEKFALATQPATTQPLVTWSGRSYLRQYDQTPDKTHQQTTSPVKSVAPYLPMNKGKQKEV